MEEGMNEGWGFTVEADKRKRISSLPFSFCLTHFLPLSVFVKLQREKHLSLVWVALSMEGICHLCEGACARRCACVSVRVIGREKQRAAASIARLPPCLRVFDRSPAVWWPIQRWVLCRKCLISLSGHPVWDWCVGLLVFGIEIAKNGNRETTNMKPLILSG